MSVQAVCDVADCGNTAPLGGDGNAIPLGWTLLRIPLEDVAQAKYNRDMANEKPPAFLAAIARGLGATVEHAGEPGPAYRQVICCGKHDLPKFKP